MTAGASWATPFLPAGSAAEPASTIRFMLTVGTPVRGASTTFSPFDRVKRSKLGKSAWGAAPASGIVERSAPVAAVVKSGKGRTSRA
ncbi:hypothetical protein D3C86_1693030 [compost metagenome]